MTSREPPTVEADASSRPAASPEPVRASDGAGSRLAGLPWFALGIIAVAIVASVAAPLLAPLDPNDADIGSRLLPPVGFSVIETTATGADVLIEGTWDHPLGTDSVGRDLLSRLIFGARYSLAVALAAMFLGAVVGTTVGLVSGYVGGVLDMVIMRLVDVFYSFPVVLLALLLTVVRGPGFSNVIFAIAFIVWTRFARVVRGEALQLRSRDFVLDARISGASAPRILVRHLLPNVVPTLIVLVSLQLGWTILIEASLSFLGAGLPPTTPAWGVMIESGQRLLRSAWWVATVPGVAIVLVVLAFNLLGDWLRDTLDPHLSHL